MEKQSRNSSQGETETSRFFEPSRSSEKRKERDDDMNSSSSSKTQSNGGGGRQMLLSFGSKGKLATKAPLTNPTPRSDASRLSLADVAQETISFLPGLLATRPDVGREGELFTKASPLDPTSGPGLPPTKIRVIDADSFDAALSLPPSRSNPNKPPLVLNMANANHAGGGWKHGAVAQEEALCYRSSLFFTLKIRYYPIPERGAIYSPKVLVIRDSMSNGHGLVDLRQPAQLPVLSVVSVAAVCLPDLVKAPSSPAASSSNRQTYARASDRELMRDKIRTTLRVAAQRGHRQLVLGALGCGAFRNPVREVAEMWKDVLTNEKEFRDGGWWEDVVFAVLGGKGQGGENFETFKRTLDGLQV